MRRRLRSNNSTILKLAMVGIVAMAGGFLLTSLMASKGETQALSATEFQPGRIIDDSIFYNPNTMTAAEIDAFIDSHNPACDMWGTQKVYGNVTRAEYVKQLRASGNTKYHDPPFVCISEYYENPETHKTNFSTGGKKEEGMLSAGEIIYEAAQEYNINPQVLLVMLKKESYVWGDDWPHDFQYNTVMGYACPDGAPCDTKYYGFYNQVMMAAWQLNYYRDHIYSYNYRPYTTNNILYNPDRSCGSKSVYLENIATTSLYIYTPYVPNDAALANYPGTSWCGSYGNRNFYMYFREWFGSTLGDYSILTNDLSGTYVIKNPGNHSAITENDADNVETSQITNGSASQEWIFERDKNTGNYKIRNQSSGKYLSITNNTVQNKTNIVTKNNDNTQGQEWILAQDYSGHLLILSAANSRYALDLQDGNSNIQLYESIRDNNHQYWILDKPEPKTDTIDSSKLYTIQNPGNNLFLSSSQKNVQTSSEQQNWKFIPSENGDYYSILNILNNEVLDISSAAFANKTNVQLYASNNTCAQRWIIRAIDQSEYQIKNACYPKFVLDLQDGLSNVQIYTKTNDDNLHQQWIIEEASEESTQKITTIKTASDINESSYYRIVNPENNSALSSTNSNVVTKAKDSSDESQLWNISKNDNAYYTISNKVSGTVLDVSGGAFTNKTNVQLYASNNTCAQRWTIQQNSSNGFSIKNHCYDSFVLDLQDGLSNVQIYTKTNDDNLHQQWIIEE